MALPDPLFTPYPLIYSATAAANTPLSVTEGLLTGGAVIQNPLDAEDQGIPIVEDLRISIVGPDADGVLQDVIILQPGESCSVPAGFDGKVWVQSATAGHMFSGIVLFPYSPFVPFDTIWPPKTFTTALQVLRSYLYQQYNDDEDLQVFVNAYNSMTQQYITWFAEIMLPVYARNDNVSGDLLDWVALGLYGLRRPTLTSGVTVEFGLFNTGMFNSLMFNEDSFEDTGPVFLTDDDLFKRILTWHLYKGDGKLFNIRWLKRRIMRFLTGDQGGNGRSSAGDPSTADMYPPDETYYVSITFGAHNEVNINLLGIRRTIISGAMFNADAFNDIEFNDLGTSTTIYLTSPFAPFFKYAVEAGALELPFQFSYTVNIN